MKKINEYCACISEKEELVNLVLIHIDNPNNCSPESHSSQTFTMGTEHTDDTRSNAFDQIRSTCQNLFTTFTEKISTGIFSVFFYLWIIFPF